jgi:ribosomal protein L11 methyltransferase
MHVISLSVPPHEADLAADALWGLGVAAIEERHDPRTGSYELWTSLGADPEAVVAASDSLRWPWQLHEVDPGIAQQWREHARLIRVDDGLVIVPSWKPEEQPGDAISILIDPEDSFGMGDHPSTLLALQALRSHLDGPMSVLDVGCGSGVLAIGAAVTGAGRVRAIDISRAAVEATRSNAERNGVADRVEVDGQPISELDGRFDLVVANILLPALVSMAPDLRRVTVEGGVIICSGILEARTEPLIEAMGPARLIERRRQGPWAALTFVR